MVEHLPGVQLMLACDTIKQILTFSNQKEFLTQYLHIIIHNLIFENQQKNIKNTISHSFKSL